VIWLKRTKGVGIISKEDAINWGMTGPSLRGSGVKYDVRKAFPYSSYDEFDFDIPIGSVGDVYDRYIVRLREMEWSNAIVEQTLERLPKGPVISDNPWIALPPKDNVLTVLESGGREAAAGGDIVTADEYANFELKIDYNITKGANSGIKYFVDTELNKGEGSSIGCEYQILDDAVHPDAKAGVNGNRKNAGLYDLIPPQNVRFNGVGEWNRARIVVRGRHVEHWLNLFKTVEYERATQMWRALVDHSKYVVWRNFGEAPKGHILLQDHGNREVF
jgi:hypothetical protein